MGTSALPDAGRLLAVDIGEKRIGLALSDPSQSLAHPLATITRRAGKRFPMQQLRAHLDEHQPVGVLMGLPQRARAAGGLIAEKTGLPVEYWDERMTTARALVAVREMGGNPRGREGEVDRLAATVLLQNYMDSRRR
jgi:putative Holliday junction resolvase